MEVPTQVKKNAGFFIALVAYIFAVITSITDNVGMLRVFLWVSFIAWSWWSWDWWSRGGA